MEVSGTLQYLPVPHPPETPIPLSPPATFGRLVQLAPVCWQSQPVLSWTPTHTPAQVFISTFITAGPVPFHQKYLFTSYLPSQVEGELPEAWGHFSCIFESLSPNPAKCLYRVSRFLG